MDNSTVQLDSKIIRHFWIVALVVFIVSFATLTWHAAPSVTFHDSGEFTMMAASAGIGHPPGAPTYSLLASLFLKIFRFNDPAYGTNLFYGVSFSIIKYPNG
jgi:hypothetical protein